MEIRLNLDDGEKRHQCTAQREGEWLVFTCKRCAGFERRVHLPSGEIKVRMGSDPWILHEGNYMPVGFDADVTSAN
jgi:hypothetical protein